MFRILTLGILILILLVGLFCLFAEFFLFPGLTLAGILGGLCLLVGVYLAYAEFGYTTGNIVFLSTLVSAGFTFWAGVRRLSGRRYAIHDRIDSRVNVVDGERIRPGDRGKAVSALRPGGTAILHDQRMEVFTKGEFLAAGTPVEVVKVERNKVWVQAAE